MATALALFGRELAMLALLSALGAGPAMLLPRDLGRGTRALMAPVLGLCLGVCFFMTLIWRIPASKTYWTVPVVAAASIAVACWLARREAGTESGWNRPNSRSVVRFSLQCFFVFVVVVAPVTYTLVVRSSVGPAGFVVGDSQGYVSEIDGMQHQSIHGAVALIGSRTYEANITQRYWSDYASNAQELDATSIAANLDSLTGWTGTESQSAFFEAYLLAGAFGLFASVRGFLRRASWSAAVAGALFAGAMFLQLFFDGSEGAVTGLSVTVPLVFVSSLAIARPRWQTILLSASILGGITALYTLFLPGFAAAFGVVVFGLALRYLWIHRSFQGLARPAGLIVFTVVLGGLLDPVASLRAIRYTSDVIHGKYASVGLPEYGFLTPGNIPSWVLQFHPLYRFIYGSMSGAQGVIVNVVLPLSFVAIILGGFRRHLFTVLIIAAACGAAMVGGYERVVKSCSYCEERNLLTITPLGIALFGIGLGTIAWNQRRAIRCMGAVIAAGIVGAEIWSGYTALMMFRDYGYFLDHSAREAIAHVPPGAPIDLEGFGESPVPSPEQGLVYLLAEERSWGRVSLPGDFNDDGSLIYLGSGGYSLADPQFNSAYAYVLTRLPSVRTLRRTVVAYRGIALERRVARLDITPDYGLSVPLTRQDLTGLATLNPYVQGGEPVKFIVSGQANGAVYLNLRFALFVPPPHVDVVSGGSLRTRVSSGILDVCVRATGSSTIRTATIRVAPSGGVELTSMLPSVGRCRSQR